MQNWNYYATVGDNGYGLSDKWAEIDASDDFIKKGWKKGFNSEEEAYEWIQMRCKKKWAFQDGICSFDYLRQNKFFILEEPETNKKSNLTKPVTVTSPKKTLKELLDEDDDVPNTPLTGGRKRNYQQEFIKAFELFITRCFAILDAIQKEHS